MKKLFCKTFAKASRISIKSTAVLLVAAQSLAMNSRNEGYYQFEVFDKNFKPVLSLSSKNRNFSDQADAIQFYVKDSNILYVKIQKCIENAQCQLTKINYSRLKEKFKLEALGSENQLYAAMNVNYKISLDNIIEDQKINFRISTLSETTNSSEFHVHSEQKKDDLHIKADIHFTPRFTDHLVASKYIRDFHVQENATDGGFLGLTGMTIKAIFREKSTDEIENNLGLVVDEKEIMGVHDIPWGPNSKEKVVSFSCAMCHFGKAAGIIIPGLGNKNATPSGLAKVGLDFEKSTKYKSHSTYSDLFLSKEDKKFKAEINKETKIILESLQSPLTNNLTQGLTSVNQTPLRFYRDLDEKVPDNYPRAPSKAQSMWGLKEKRMHGGQFSDGGASGDTPLWSAGYDMGSLMKTEYMLKAQDKLEKVQEAYGKLLPPAYPFVIDFKKAEKGKEHFEVSCAKCHADRGNAPYTRDLDGYPVYFPPKLIQYRNVQTESERMHLFDGLNKLLEKHPLKEVLKLTDKSKRPFLGYYAPRLVSVWSRYPYLHNGSVPSIMALLTHPSQRPKYFSLKNAGNYERFDEKNLGLTLPENSKEIEELEEKAKLGDQGVYDISRDEHSNMGHAKGLDLSLDEKYELIEYLKTL